MSLLHIVLQDRRAATLREIIEGKCEQMQGRTLTIEEILDGSLASMLREDRIFPLTQHSSTVFINLLKDSLKNHQTLKLQASDKSKLGYAIVRNNHFANLTNRRDLIKLVNNSPKGVLVDDQLLKYTYKGIKDDIEECLRGELFIKIKHRNKKMFFIFSSSMEQVYALSNAEKPQFGIDLYLQACSKLIPPPRKATDSERSSKKIRIKPSCELNKRIAGYQQMKQQWIRRSMKKPIQG